MSGCTKSLGCTAQRHDDGCPLQPHQSVCLAHLERYDSERGACDTCLAYIAAGL